MKAYQSDFIQLAINHNVLTFGEFTLKSGRISPYFFNAGKFYTGNALAALGRFYAQAIMEAGVEFDVLLGPAYKGISLAAVTAAALYTEHGQNVNFSYNRKERKQHGEGGVLVGAPLTGKVLVIDDVITAGTAIREVMTLVEREGATVTGIVIGLDRQEKGPNKVSAIDQISRDHGVDVFSIAKLDDVITYLKNDQQLATVELIEAYRCLYGVE